MKKLKPLQIYLIGAGLGIASGIVIKPFSETAHTIVVVLALLVCIGGVVKYFRS